jgi:hypothetical protein
VERSISFEDIQPINTRKPVPQILESERFAEKNRKSYQRAAEWLAELKTVYLLLNQVETWRTNMRELKENTASCRPFRMK